MAQNDAENAEIIIPHFQKIYNNQKPVDFEFINEHLKQFPVELDLDGNLDFDEFNEVLGQIANGKAGGENKVPPEALKALNDKHRERLHKFANNFFDGIQDFDSWHRGLLTLVHKPGRPKDDPNNYRGINLMDVLSKVLCRTFNTRLYKLLEKNGTKFQFGATPRTGCREAIFTLKSVLFARRNHNLGSYVAFIDLVKVFDTADHK